MRRVAATGATVAALLLALSAPANAAETVSLGFAQDTGPNPSVFFLPERVERAVSFHATFTADPVQAIEIESYISCTRGPEVGSESASNKTEAIVTPPYSVTIPASLAGAKSCWVSLSAEPPCCDGEDDPGTIRVEATALREPAPAPPQPPPPPPPPPATGPAPPPAAVPIQPSAPPYWRQCRRPRWLASGSLTVHGSLPCGRAKHVATEVWRRPKRAGHRLRFGRYFCVRSGHHRKTAVRCAWRGERFKLAGELRRR